MDLSRALISFSNLLTSAKLVSLLATDRSPTSSPAIGSKGSITFCTNCGTWNYEKDSLAENKQDVECNGTAGTSQIRWKFQVQISHVTQNDAGSSSFSINLARTRLVPSLICVDIPSLRFVPSFLSGPEAPEAGRGYWRSFTLADHVGKSPLHRGSATLLQPLCFWWESSIDQDSRVSNSEGATEPRSV